MPPYLVGASPTLPDDWMTTRTPTCTPSWEEFAKQLFWDYQLGEVFVLATARYANGWPARFHVVSPWLVNVDMVGGRRRYAIGAIDVTADMLHIRYQAHGRATPTATARSRPAAPGSSPPVCWRGTPSNLAPIGGIPNAVLKHPDELTVGPGDAAAGPVGRAPACRRSGLPAVLSGGIEFETLQFSPADMALFELSQFNESRIAVLLGVPPFLVGLPSGGDSMTYCNVIALVRLPLAGRARARRRRPVMAGLSAWLTPRGTTHRSEP